MHTDLKLVVAGDANGVDDYKASLHALAAGDKRIVFAGMVEGRKLAELFSHAAVYVQPSEIEGLSIALLEAMSYARCCLTSDIPENKEAIGEAGYTFKSGDVASLKTELNHLLARPDIREEAGIRARLTVLPPNSSNYTEKLSLVVSVPHPESNYPFLCDLSPFGRAPKKYQL
jgi:glycosyltransferase involved in cell wall biosynthesis